MAMLAQAGDPPGYGLAFDAEFLATGHDLSPLNLPRESLSTQVVIYRPGTTPFPGGLPGLIADSLPDTWAEKVQRIIYPTITTLLGKLAAVGNRGPGAISFTPALDEDEDTVSANLAKLADEANRIAREPEVLRIEQIDQALKKGSPSLGGAHPKMTALLPETGEVLSVNEVLVGGVIPQGYNPCVLKFSPEDEEGGGAVEYAFARMAQASGLNVARPYLVNDGVRKHFATARFDRNRGPDGAIRRRHVHTLSGLLHHRSSYYDVWRFCWWDT